MRRLFAMIVGITVMLGASGCAQQSESDKMLDQMNRDAKKATNQIKKDINNL